MLKEKLDLRVLHIRNTKLQDSSALKLLEQIIVHRAKVKYLGMSMNPNLGFQFQNGLIKMLRETALEEKKHHVKLLDLKYCNITKANMQLIS